jgi:hypothetical protein
MKRSGIPRIFPLALILLAGCIFSKTQSAGSGSEEKSMAEVVFQVTLPPSLQQQPQYMLEVVDEVTGLFFNPVRYPLIPIDATHYFGRIPFNNGSIIKYRYIRMDDIPKVEHNANNEQVRYRLHQVNGPAILEETVAAWEDSPYTGSTGNLEGLVTNQENIPIPNAMVVAGGERVFTNSEGHFSIKTLPTGMQNLAVLSVDGTQSFFEQGARIAENAVTPARIHLESRGNVNITFEVTPPPGMESGNSMRMIGDLYQLGNTFADLEGGMSTIASRAPLLQFDPERNVYTTVLSLPAGTFFRYKFSLGDGFWNAETNENGQFVTREFTVPSEDYTVREAVKTFYSPGTAPVEFQITAPLDTPQGDTLSIQFNPFAWMGSIPLSPQDNNQWKYTLSSPLNLILNTMFRVCRNDQCGETDAVMDGLPDAFTPTSTTQTIQINPTTWVWMDDQGAQPILPDQVPAKGADFIKGVEFDRNYQPRWQPGFENTYKTIQGLNANWVFITPTWSFFNGIPFTIRLEPGKNPLWLDTSQQIQLARSKQLFTAIFPSLIGINSFQLNADPPLSRAEWEEWFKNYRSFLLFYADLASVNGADALVLGGTGASFSLPDRIAVSDLSTADASDFASVQWQLLIADVRSHFSGRIFWAERYPLQYRVFPPFIRDMDGIYLLWDGISNYDPTGSPLSIADQVSVQFTEEDIQNLTALGKPTIVGLWIESSTGRTRVCPETGVECLDEMTVPLNSINDQLDLQQQVNLYAGTLAYFTNQPWVSGVVSRGFYPPADLLDASASIHGKPAGETVLAWFSGLTKIINK